MDRYWNSYGIVIKMVNYFPTRLYIIDLLITPTTTSQSLISLDRSLVLPLTPRPASASLLTNKGCYSIYIKLLNWEIIYSNRKHISGCMESGLTGERDGRARLQRGIRKFWGMIASSLSWLWQKFHRCMHRSKMNKVYTLNVYSSFYVNYTLINSS